MQQKETEQALPTNIHNYIAHYTSAHVFDSFHDININNKSYHISENSWAFKFLDDCHPENLNGQVTGTRFRCCNQVIWHSKTGHAILVREAEKQTMMKIQGTAVPCMHSLFGRIKLPYLTFTFEVLAGVSLNQAKRLYPNLSQ